MSHRFRPRDRLSYLPDEILHHILSFDFDAKQLVQSSIISKRWQKLWEETHALSLNCDLTLHPDKFINIVNTIFAKLSKIDKFSFTAQHFANCVTDDWVSHVVSVLQASELHLDGLWLKDTSILGNVKTLTLNWIIFLARKKNNEFFLSLKNVESLRIEFCDLLNVEKIRLDAPLLKDFIFESCHDDCSQKQFSMLAPNLTSLQYRGGFFKDFDLGKVTTLINADIQPDLKIGSNSLTKNVTLGFLKKILNEICNVKSLILGADAFQIFAALPDEMKSVGCLFQNLKYLKLTNWRKDGHIVALRKLLFYFPFIETLVLQRTQIPSSTYKVTNWESQLLLSSRAKLHHLMTMEVQNIDAVENDSNKCKDSNEYKFLEFMLKHAPNLNTVTIRETRKITALKETQIVEFCRELQKRAYSSVTIVFMLGKEVRVTIKGIEAHAKVEPVVKRRGKKILSSADKHSLIM